MTPAGIWERQLATVQNSSGLQQAPELRTLGAGRDVELVAALR